jgi:hypothetical protein
VSLAFVIKTGEIEADASRTSALVTEWVQRQFSHRFIPAGFKTGVIAMDWKARFGFHNRNGKF